MRHYMGIDGGGSNLRVVIVDEAMNEIVLQRATTANPSIIGFDASKALIQENIKEALSQANLDTVDALGIGIAGAPVTRSRAWLESIANGVLPETHFVPSSDSEIALVGTFGQRRGILILAGTGSIAYGVNTKGESLFLGGWGYLLGDQGSGYWLGTQALRLLSEVEDDDTKSNSLIVDKLRQHPEFTDRHSLVSWLYSDKSTAVARIAKLAPIVLESAEQGDSEALMIVKTGAVYLVNLVETMKRRLKMPDARIALAGSLLTNDTILSREVMAALLIAERPVPLYEAVVGAALLAKLDFDSLL